MERLTDAHPACRELPPDALSKLQQDGVKPTDDSANRASLRTETSPLAYAIGGSGREKPVLTYRREVEWL